MARKKQSPLTGRLWVPDPELPGGYRPWKSLSEEEKQRRRVENDEAGAATLQRCINRDPTILLKLPEV